MSAGKEITARFRQWGALVRGSIMEGLTFRTSTFMSIFGNLVYLVIIYFLWRAIYDSSPGATVGGMTFYDTMIYLVLAAAMFHILDSFVVWDIGRSYQTGELVELLVKPMDYQVYLLFSHIGNCIVSLVITFLPTFVIVYFFTKGGIALGINLVFFAISIVFAFLINYCVDFLVGTICLYTQSVWGVNIMKEVVVSLLSGATIPLAFFPQGLRNVVNVLPFQAIYHTPLHMLTDGTLELPDYLQELGVQMVWILVMYALSKLFWNHAMRKLTVNGG